VEIVRFAPEDGEDGIAAKKVAGPRRQVDENRQPLRLGEESAQIAIIPGLYRQRAKSPNDDGRWCDAVRPAPN
jgi:hypothetical protein